MSHVQDSVYTSQWRPFFAPWGPWAPLEMMPRRRDPVLACPWGAHGQQTGSKTHTGHSPRQKKQDIKLELLRAHTCTLHARAACNISERVDDECHTICNN